MREDPGNAGLQLAPEAFRQLDGLARRKGDAPDTPCRQAEHDSVETERHRNRDRNQKSGERRADERSHHLLDAPDLAIGLFQIAAFNQHWKHRLRRIVTKHFRRAQQEGDGRQCQYQRQRRAGVIVKRQGRGCQDQRHHPKTQDQPEHVGSNHHFLPVRPIDHDAGRQGKQKPRQAGGKGHQRNQQRVAGDERRKPRKGQSRDAVAEIGEGTAGKQQSIVAVLAQQKSGHGGILSGRLYQE